jgi:alpha-beta hydrolase superfamily lysophospholipase
MIERSLAFGPEGSLIGTLCLPDAGAGRKARVGQVLFNAGVVHRVGPHRINVKLARDLARRGIPSIRFDLAGLGDSAAPRGELSFEDQAVADVRAAMDLLATEGGVERFSLFGFCSGGCHSYATAIADPRVAGLLMYDTYIYPTPRSRMNRYLAPIRSRGLLRTAGGWLRRRPGTLRRWLRGLVGAPVAVAPGAEGSLFRVPSRAEFARQVTALHERGVKVGVMYSEGFEDYNYRDQFVDAFREFGLPRFVSSDYLETMNHTATVIATRDDFARRIEDWTAALDVDGAAPPR